MSHHELTEAEWEEFRQRTSDPSYCQDENGIDLSLIDENLRLTPTERLRKHDQALAGAMMLRRAGEQFYERRQSRTARASA